MAGLLRSASHRTWELADFRKMSGSGYGGDKTTWAVGTCEAWVDEREGWQAEKEPQTVPLFRCEDAISCGGGAW